MLVKYGFEISSEAVCANIKRLIDQIYKLLPLREEGGEWGKLLQSIIEELYGMSSLFFDQQALLLKILCKLEGLFKLTDKNDFFLYRGVVFECLSLLSEFKTQCLAKI